MSLSVPANETGMVRVFALSMGDEQAKALKINSAAAKGENGASSLQELVLGAMRIDEAHVEVFPITDLGEMTLADYMIEGAGITTAASDADRLKLNSLEGWIMVVYSGAFSGLKQTLNPSSQLTFVGAYPQVGIDWTPQIDLSTPSALPNKDASLPATKKRPSDAAMSGRIAMVALLVMFLLVGLMVWIAG